MSTEEETRRKIREAVSNVGSSSPSFPASPDIPIPALKPAPFDSASGSPTPPPSSDKSMGKQIGALKKRVDALDKATNYDSELSRQLGEFLKHPANGMHPGMFKFDEEEASKRGVKSSKKIQGASKPKKTGGIGARIKGFYHS